MLKIKAQYNEKENTYRFVMKGHCGFAEKGRDIICAGATALCLALAQTVRNNEDKMTDKPKIKIGNGRAYIEFMPQKEYKAPFETSLYTVIQGFKVLEYEYPEHIKIL